MTTYAAKIFGSTASVTEALMGSGPMPLPAPGSTGVILTDAGGDKITMAEPLPVLDGDTPLSTTPAPGTPVVTTSTASSTAKTTDAGSTASTTGSTASTAGPAAPVPEKTATAAGAAAKSWPSWVKPVGIGALILAALVAAYFAFRSSTAK